MRVKTRMPPAPWFPKACAALTSGLRLPQSTGLTWPSGSGASRRTPAAFLGVLRPSDRGTAVMTQNYQYGYIRITENENQCDFSGLSFFCILIIYLFIKYLSNNCFIQQKYSTMKIKGK